MSSVLERISNESRQNPPCIFLCSNSTSPLTKAKLPKNKSLLFCILSVSHRLVNPVCVYLEVSFSYILFHTTPYQTSLSYFPLITSCIFFLSFSLFIQLFLLYDLSLNCLHGNISLSHTTFSYTPTDTPHSQKRFG